VTAPPKRERERAAGFVEMLVATKKENCIVNLEFFEAALI
jgi:hypothetical protein